MKSLAASAHRTLSARVLLAVLLALALLAAAGCAASPSNSNDYGNGTEDKGGADTGAAKAGPTSAIDRKVISTARAGLESDDVVDAADRLAAAVEAMGGYVAGSSRTEVSTGRYRATMTLKVPSGKLAALVARLPEFGRVLSTETGTEDVTDAYYDAQARLKNALAQETQLLGIMEKATTIQDTLLVRAELDKVQQTIEQLKGQIALWDALVDMGTLAVTIQPTAELVQGGSVFRVVTGSELWKGVSKAFLGSVAFLANAGAYLLMAVSALLVPGLVVLAVVLLIVALVRARRRARDRRNPPAAPRVPPAPPAPPAA